jgi:ligand-binding sensor domain-containing protein
MKLLLPIFLICFVEGLAQDFSDSWTGLFSFANIIDIEQTDDEVFAASENAVFVYDIASQTFTTITTVNGLSGDLISQIHYNDDAQQLVIGYVNGLLQVRQDEEILDVVAIRDKQTITPDRKRINEFLQIDDLLYIATEFGIALYDLDQLEFDDTYFIGEGGAQLRVQSLEVADDFLYAATADAGIRRADITDPFLINFMNWRRVNSGRWDEVFKIGDNLYGINQNRKLEQFNGSIFADTGVIFPSRALDAFVSSSLFTVVGAGYVQVLDANEQILTNITQVDGESYDFTTVSISGTDLFVGTTSTGTLRLDSNTGSLQEIILADGPSRNSAFSINALPSELWVGYGDYDLFYDPFPLERFGVSHFVEDQWINYSNDDVNNIASIGSITINPDVQDQLYLNSMHNGIQEFNDGVAGILYGVDNSSLTSIEPPSDVLVRVPSSAFDSQGNLWAIAAQVDLALNRLSPTGQWTGFDVSDEAPGVITSSGVTKIAITSSDNIIFGTTDAGLIGYNPQENRYGILTEGIQEGNLVNNYVGALEIDQNGQLWVGSNLGIRVLFNANSILSENPSDARAIIIEDENGIPRELLADEAVLDIEVDGNNRKWVATASSGAFLFSPSGQETIFQFTKNNSPLPSDGVNDIAIDNTTGRVYFATDNGIVAFQGDRSSEPADDLENVFAFPNPVKPGFDGNVTIDGLTERARIKITDIEGNLVFEVVSQGGSVQWDTRSFNGNEVASGVYMLLISTDDNTETTVSKIMVIR